MYEDDEDAAAAQGVVVERDRGPLPFALLHGEPLVAWAARAMGRAGVRLLDLTTPWQAVRESGLPLVWHDALCPATPPAFIAECVRRAVAGGVVVAGVLPVTDTVKTVVPHADGAMVGATLDRERLRRVASPLVLPVEVVAGLDDWPPADLKQALGELRRVLAPLLLTAPESARRVHDVDDLRALEALAPR
jgi:2-C-methyl-D-erythritol 4-phosphate cytidylyltransferase